MLLPRETIPAGQRRRSRAWKVEGYLNLAELTGGDLLLGE